MPNLLCLLFLHIILASNKMYYPWAIYYGNQEPLQTFHAYELLVFNSEEHPDLEELLDVKKTILGYLNLAEVFEKSDVFERLGEKGLLIEENVNWPGDWSIDIRDPFWKKLLLEEIIPIILEEGFLGLLLDQVDVAIELEKNNPQKYEGMAHAAIDLIKSIHARFPKALLMLNRAYEIIPKVGADIHYVLAETLYSFYDFKTQHYNVRSEQEYVWQLQELEKIKQQFPALKLFSLDYWDPKDHQMYTKIYSVETEHDLNPYVTTPWFNILPFNPLLKQGK